MIRYLLGVLLLLAACAAPPADPFTIGAIEDLTKQSAIHGNNARSGIELAVQHINEQGGIGGRPLKVLFEDEQCDPKMAVAATRKLVQAGVPVILGPTCSSSALAIAPITEEAGIVLLASVPSTPHLREAGGSVFRNRAAGDADGKKMAEFASEELDAMTAGVIYVNLDNGIGYKNAFEKRFEDLGGTIVLSLPIELDQTDFRTELLKVKDEGPDVLFIASQTGHLVVKQAGEIGIESHLIGPITMETPEMLSVAGDAAEGIYYSHPAFDPLSGEEIVQEFQQEYLDAYGKMAEIRAAESYDAVMLIADAMRECATRADCIRDHLYGVANYTGVSGKTTFDEYGEVDKPLVIKTVRNGEFVALDPSPLNT